MALNVRDLVSRHLTRHTIGFWVWAIVTATLTFIVLLLTAKVFFAGTEITRRAVDDGQRATIIVSSGETEGNMRHTKRAATHTAENNGADALIVSKEGLAPAPLASISEQSDKGLIPITGRDGTLPWKYYARPYAPKEKRPVVAVVLVNLGLSKPLTSEALKLPHGFTLSFSPYANDARLWAKQAREEGFESLVDLPTQPENFPISDPGPYGLLDNLNPNESSARLHWALSRFPGFVGVTAAVNDGLTANINAIRPTLVELAGRGVLFVYVKTPKNVAIAELAKSRAFYTVGIDKILDEEISYANVEHQLADLVELAKKQGSAVAVARSYPPTLEALEDWAEALDAQGVDLVPISAIALRP